MRSSSLEGVQSNRITTMHSTDAETCTRRRSYTQLQSQPQAQLKLLIEIPYYRYLAVGATSRPYSLLFNNTRSVEIVANCDDLPI